LPKPGLLPHTSQTEATVRSIGRWKVCQCRTAPGQ
jgi:hypothetical protein